MRVTYLKGVPQYHAAPFMIVTRHLSMLRVYLVGFFSFKFDYRVGVFFIAVMFVDFQLAKVVNKKNSLVALPLLEHFFFYGAYAPLVRTTSSMHTANEHDYLYRASYGGSCCSNSLIISTAETKRGLKIIPPWRDVSSLFSLISDPMLPERARSSRVLGISQRK